MNMVLIVARSELLRRIKTKSFILVTLLAPTLLIGVFALIAILTVSTFESDSRTIGVVDHTGVVLDRLLAQEEDADLVLIAADSSTVQAAVMAGRYDGYVTIPKGILDGEESLRYYAAEGGGYGVTSSLRFRVRRAVRNHLLDEAGVPNEVRDIYRTSVSISSVQLDDEGEETGSQELYGGLGALMAFLLYFALIFYGNTIFLGVMEEKRTRIVEVLLSSTRPFSLLMGKILGIGGMGLVQFSCWAVMIVGLTAAAGTVVGFFMDPTSLGLGARASATEMLDASGIVLPTLKLSVVVWFILFFVGGFLLYAGLFAAVGSMVDQPQDAQAVMLPVMLPLILPMLFISSLLESPNSTLAVVLSMIPVTAPVPMAIRLVVTNLPFWEVLLSFILLLGGIAGTMWVTSRIYRVGILMYGKKASLKDAVRWFRSG